MAEDIWLYKDVERKREFVCVDTSGIPNIAVNVKLK